MKRHLFYLCCYLAAALFIVSCGDPLSPSANMSVKTGEATQLTCLGAVIAGNVKCSEGDASEGLEMGVLFSVNSGVLLNTATKFQASPDSIEWDGNRARYAVRLKFIKSDTTYYYRCYVSRDGVIEYGKTKSFMTKSISSLIQTGDVTAISENGAMFHGSMDLTDIEYNQMHYGFQIKRTQINSNYWTYFDTRFSDRYSFQFSDGAFSAEYNYLLENTQYSYCAFVSIDNRIYQGEIKTFTTR